jgi:protein-tyrosine phosphatase
MILPGQLWIRGRTNHISLEAKRTLATELGLHWAVGLCPIPDYEWADVPLDYYYWPMADGARIPEDIQGRARFLTSEIAEGRPGLIYCNAGRNRSAFLAGLVMQYVEGTPGVEVVKRIQKLRPNALANPAFVRYLEAA